MKRTEKAPSRLARKTITVSRDLWRDVKIAALRENLRVSEFVQKALWRAVHKGSGEDLST